MDLHLKCPMYSSVLLLIAVLGPKLSSGYIFCHCDTLQCRKSGLSECRAEFYCYTVFRFTIPDSLFPNLSHSTDKSKYGLRPNDGVAVDRGCVANGLSTKCSSDHRPRVQNGTTLVTYCCRDAWCNSEKIPPSKLLNLGLKKSDVNDLTKQDSNSILAATKYADPIQSTDPNLEIHTPKKSYANRIYQNPDEIFNPLHDRPKRRKIEPRRKISSNEALTHSDHQVEEPEMDSTENNKSLLSALHLGALTKPAYIAMGAALVILIFGLLLLSAAFYVYRKHQRLTRLSLRGRHQPSNQSHSIPIPDGKYNQAETIFTVQKMNSAFLNHHDSQTNSTNENLDHWADELAGATAYGNMNRCICCRRNISNPSTEPYNYPDESESELSLADRLKKQCANNKNSKSNTKSPEPSNSAASQKARTLPSNQTTISWVHSQRNQEPTNKINRKLVRSKARSSINSRWVVQQQPDKLKPLNPNKSRKNDHPCRQILPEDANKSVPWFTEIEINKSTDGTVNSDPLTSAIYSGVSLNTDYSSSHDHNSDGALSSIIPCNVPSLLYQQLIHNTDAQRTNLYLTPSHSPIGIQMLDRQRGTGKTSSGGEESKQTTHELFDPRHNGWLLARNFESSSGASTAATGREIRNSNEGQFDRLDIKTEGNLIGFANFRKAQENNAELVTPYAQFQLSPDSSVYDGC